MMMFTKSWQPVLASVSLAFVSAAWAGDEMATTKSPPTTAPAPTVKERPLLSGPEVEDVAARPMRRGRDGSMMTDRRHHPVVPARLWLRAIQAMELDETQREAVKARLDAHRDALIAFNEEHGVAMREVRIRMRDNRGNPEAMAELRKEMQVFEEKMPRIEAVQRDLWRLLREEQQETLRAQLAEIRAEIIKRREAEQERAGQQAQERRRPAVGDRETPQLRRRPGAGEGPGRDAPPARRRPATGD